MCGRYTQTRGPQWLEQEFEVDATGDMVAPRYNIAPTQEAPVVLFQNGRMLRSMKWGLALPWNKDRPQGVINVRAESLIEKPGFKSSFQKRRCLVPADGFFEWLNSGKRKTPVRFVMKDESLFAFAGIWDGCEPGTFAIITTSANEAVLPVHDRMPVILEKGQYGAWLQPEPLPEQVGVSLLHSFPAEAMTSYKVDPVVNSAASDSPACIRRIQVEETGWLF